MGLTGVIYAAIVVAWAAYLVPLALRRHEESSRSRSIERFSSAMHVLARRRPSGASAGRMVVTPARVSERLVGPSLKPAPETPVPVTPMVPRPTRAALRAAAARRRRVLTLLLALALVTVVVAVVGVVPLWSAGIPVGLVAAFLIIARTSVRRASDEFWLQSEAAAEPSNVVRRTAARVDASHGSVRTDSDPDEAADDEPTITLDAAAVAVAKAGLTEDRVVAVAMRTADGDSLWDPLPVTLPTYVDKPAAKRTIRTIELGEPGTWSSGHSEADSKTAGGTDPDQGVQADEGLRKEATA